MSEITSMGQRVCSECGRGGCRLYRPYGEFLRETRIVCGFHLPPDANIENGVNKGGWWVPLFEDTDGSVWGYVDAPREVRDYFLALPD